MSRPDRPTGMQPRFLVNTIPKSGTNLLMQMFCSIPEITHPLDMELFDSTAPFANADRLENLNAGEFAVGHLYYDADFVQRMDDMGMPRLFVYRDPRDVLVSLVHFILEHPEYHQMDDLYRYLTAEGNSRKAQLLSMINGVNLPPFQYPAVGEWLRPFLGWLADPGTLAIAYEDLVTSKKRRIATQRRIVRYLWGERPAVSMKKRIAWMQSGVNPSTCGTFRKGQPGNWKEEFDDELQEAFTKQAGDILQALGYDPLPYDPLP